MIHNSPGTYRHFASHTAACLLLCVCALFATPAHTARAEHPITLLHYWTGSLAGGVSDMVDAYNARTPAFPVKAVGMEHESFKTAIRGMLASGNGPDIFSYWAGARTQSLIDAGQLAPVDAVWDTANLSAVFPATVAQACTYNGRKYAIPVTQHLVGFFYDAKRFAALGLEPPATWEQFLAVCGKLRAAGVAPLALGNREQWPAQFWFDYLLLRTAGPEYRQRLMQGRAAYTDSEVVRAFTLWRQLLDAGYFSPVTETADWADAAREVREGRAGMTLMGTWIMGYYGDQLGWKEGEDYDFFIFPAIEPGVPLVAVGPIDVLVMAAHGHEQDMRQVLTYFADTELQQVMSLGSGALAPSALVPQDFYSPLKRRLATIVQHAENWQFAYDLTVPPVTADAGLGLFAAFLRGEQRLDSLLYSMQKRMEAAGPVTGKAP